MSTKDDMLSETPESSELSQPFDTWFKRSMQEKKVAIDLLRSKLPEALLAQMDLSTLTLMNGTSILKGLDVVHADCVYRCAIGDRDGYIILASEHQSRAEKLMAFRVLQYTVGIMGNHLAQDHQKLPIVISLVIYVRPGKSPVMPAVQKDTAWCAVTCTYQAMRSRKQLGVKRLGQCTPSENIRLTLQREPKTASINAVRGLGEVIRLA